MDKTLTTGLIIIGIVLIGIGIYGKTKTKAVALAYIATP